MCARAHSVFFHIQRPRFADPLKYAESIAPAWDRVVLVIFTAADAAEVKNMTHNSDSRSNKRALLISVLVIGILVAVGCSSEKSKPAGSTMGSSSSTLNQVSLPVTSAPAVAASQSAPQKPAPKKMVRKHASMVTYKDDTYGLSFGYPRKYT